MPGSTRRGGDGKKRLVIPSLREERMPKAQLPAIGSKVRIKFGVADDVIATVIEHRGPLGVDGRQIVRVRFQFEDAEPRETEVPVDETSPVEHSLA